MLHPLLASAPVVDLATSQPVADALVPALRISAISMAAIIVVMGAFALLILLMGRIFPDAGES